MASGNSSITLNDIVLEKGLNTIDYTLTSSNGDTYTNTLEIFYDPTPISFESNLIDLNGEMSNVASVKPEIKITDANISEVKAINIKYLFNGQVESINLSKEEISSAKSEDGINYTLTLENSLSRVFEKYLNENGELIDGKMENLQVAVSSDFGKRRNIENNTTEGSTFFLDRVAPSINLALSNIVTEKPEFLSDSSFYNTDGNLYITIKQEAIEPYTSHIVAKNITINDISYTIPTNTKITTDKGYHTLILDTKAMNIDLSKNKKFDVSLMIDDAAGNSSVLKTSYNVDTVRPTHSASVINKNMTTQKTNEVTLDDTSAPFINTDAVTFDTKELNFESQVISITRNGKIVEKINTKDISDSNISKLYELALEGTYSFSVETTDKAGNVTTDNFGINVDKFASEIDMNILKSNPLYVSSPTFKVGIDKYSTAKTAKDIIVKDSMDSTDSITAIISEVGNAKNTSTHTLDSLSVDSIKNIISKHSEGDYNIKLDVEDKAKNISSASGTFVIDTKSPIIDISAKSINAVSAGNISFDAGHHNVSSVTPVVSVSDISSKPSDVEFSLNGKSIKPIKTSSDKYKLNFTLPTMSSEDIYNLQVTAKDRAINSELDTRSTSNSSMEFAIDRTAPSINVSAGSTTLNQNGTNYVTDHNSRIIADIEDFISENEHLNISTSITKNGGGSSSDSSYLFNSDDSYHLKITATDEAGNSTTFEADIIVDTVFPEIIIEGVKDGHYYNTDVASFWKIDDEDSNSSITLNGKPFAGGTITEEGEYTLVITSTDEAGNVSKMTYKFVVDKTAPEITIEGIKSDGVYTEGVIPIIKWSDTDAVVTALLNNIDYMGGEINQDGIYTLVVRGVDKAGNSTELIFKFRLNVSKPIIEFANIKDKGIYDEPLKLDIKFKDTVDYSILVNGEAYHGEELYKVGSYKVVVTAFDEDKNKTIEEINFKIVAKEDGSATIKSENQKKVEQSKKNNGVIFVSIAGLLGILLLIMLRRKKNNQ